MMKIRESKTEQKRDEIIEEFVNKGIFKIDGRQLYELNFYELMKEHTTEDERK
ncbi:Fur-regulated basic protein FbpA [Psychrobacillus psychrodurans]|uniref:Fur-regulated basic protein FbpA n=1 Tax=Psychrobacillus TaxID=1221880 RepID=UPI001F4D9AE7|nr:Fur-regulated basic protein FbpA [Psychrobacillus psychrodurans]MCK1997631.1 Fur-regulated basic protein FbpA [Psychrobacillus psychrodurans]